MPVRILRHRGVEWLGQGHTVERSERLGIQAQASTNLVMHRYYVHVFSVTSVVSDSLRIWEQVAMRFSRGSFQPRDRTCISCIADRFFTHWATWETHIHIITYVFRSTAFFPVYETTIKMLYQQFQHQYLLSCLENLRSVTSFPQQDFPNFTANINHQGILLKHRFKFHIQTSSGPGEKMLVGRP